VFHRYELCEEYAAGMWRIITGPERHALGRAAAALMRDPAAFETAMSRALDEWPFSCEAALTATIVNRIAWLGHAGCCIAVDCPEDITRAAWHTLTSSEQDAANAAALRVLMEWERRYVGAEA
jgi:hypothetical protein